MSKFITIILLSLCLNIFSQDTINYLDITGKKQGIWKKYHPNGFLRYEGQFKNDSPIGTFKHFYDNGKISMKIHHFEKGLAYANMYYETGELKATGKYKNQVKDSIWTYYHLNGNPISEEFYFNGKKEGSWKVFYESGKIAEEKNYTNNLENGNWIEYYESGQLKSKSTFENGRMEGPQYFYFENGVVKIKGNYTKDVRHGIWMYYNEDGTTKKKEEYKFGRRIDENKDDIIINEDSIIKEKKDILDFEDLFPPK